MKKIDAILANDIYKRQMQQIEEREQDRVFCRHGVTHSLDVARIAYIYNMERNLGFSKEMIYAVALLHDIGRYSPIEQEMSHHEAGAWMAQELLLAAGFSDEENKTICDAIRNHHSNNGKEGTLDALLYEADKKSRNCFLCTAYHECYWDENLKNHTITI